MALSNQQMTRLGELLDESLPLEPVARRMWLESLPDEDRPLVRTLREALLADDPSTVSSGPLDRPPRIRDLDAANESSTRQAGERLGAYELLQPLGAGGMAEVWLARRADGAFERQVALKIPRLRDMPAEMVERFARECNILATLECPGIARLYDAGVDASGVPYIAMEYVQGEPLTAWCDAHRLDVSARINLFLQVLDAVGFAHARQVIHRDIKPSNILVTEKGEVRLLDFGVARLFQAPADMPSITRIHGRALTPEYASPELLRSEPIDLRSDIYSLGVVLHELLTGARPGRPEARELAEPWRTVVNKALATVPADRYADASSFAAALRKAARTSEAPQLPWRNPRYLAAGLIVVALAVGAFLFQRIKDSAAVPSVAALAPGVAAGTVAANTSTIAVLPFVDLSEDQDQEFFSDGLSEELIALLTKIPELRVTARASSFAFRDRRKDITAIGRQLNVANILDGSVRKSDDRLRFSVQLVQASTGTVVWSETYDREIKDIFELQEDVAGAVVEALKLRLLPGKHVPASERTANAEAYEHYLQGLKYNKESKSVDDMRRAMDAFEKAVALDPNYASAYAQIALVAASIGDETVDGAMYELARSNAERAMALSPRLDLAYVARGRVRMYKDWNFAGAKEDLDTALGIDPNTMEVQDFRIKYLSATGKPTEALAVQKLEVDRNPLSAGAWSMLAATYMDARDYPKARDAFERAKQINPEKWGPMARSTLELYSGNYTEALRQSRLIKDEHFRDFAIAMAAWSAGEKEEAMAARQRLIDTVPNVFAAQLAMASAWQGDREQTYRWLDHALKLRDPGLIAIQIRPEFDKYRDEVRFERVMKRLNLPQ